VDFKALNSAFKKIESDYLSSLNDKITIYTRPQVSGTATNYSSYYDGSLNYLEPSTVSGVGSLTYETKDIYGEIYLNVFGWQYSNKEELQRIPIGNIQPDDVLFIGLSKNVLINSGFPNKGTYFEGSDYIVVEKTGYKYKVKGIYPNGMDDINSYYVLLGRTDKEQISYT